MTYPSTTFRSELDSTTRKEFDQFAKQSSDYLSREHTATGGHRAIAATGSIKERGRRIPMGEWINITIDSFPNWFIPSTGMTWTVTAADVKTMKYMLIGKTVFFTVFLQNTSIGGTPNYQLYIRLPNATRSKWESQVPAYILDNGAYQTGDVYAGVGLNFCIVQTFRDGDAAPHRVFTASTNKTDIGFTLIYEMQ